jgi:hypothetical protein
VRNRLLFLQGLDVVVADMLNMPFESETFDLVIEKGTMVRVLPTLIFFTLIFSEACYALGNSHSKEKIRVLLTSINFHTHFFLEHVMFVNQQAWYGCCRLQLTATQKNKYINQQNLLLPPFLNS